MAKNSNNKKCASCHHDVHTRGQCFTTEGLETIGVGKEKRKRPKFCECQTDTAG